VKQRGKPKPGTATNATLTHQQGPKSVNVIANVVTPIPEDFHC
jgi:hypothetical protein